MRGPASLKRLADWLLHHRVFRIQMVTYSRNRYEFVPCYKSSRCVCNLRRVTATDALTSGRLAEQNGRPPDNPNSVLQLDHHDIMLGDPLEDCVSRYCIVHDHGLPFVWFPLGTDDSAP